MKSVIRKITDAAGVLMPFFLFIFICGAYLGYKEKEFSKPAEEIKKENEKNPVEAEDIQPGVINFILLGGF